MATICRCQAVDDAYSLASQLAQTFYWVHVYETVQGLLVVCDDVQLSNRFRRGDLLTQWVAGVQFSGLTDFKQL